MKLNEYIREFFIDEEFPDYTPKHPKFWRMMRNFIICCAITNILMFGYIEFGHDRGWKRADVWYTCIHAHNHFPWHNCLQM